MVHPTIPCALTVAGSDSGGGAGVQADLSTFAEYGIHGVSAVTCLTAQNPDGIACIEPVRASVVQAQLISVLSGFRPKVGKIGMIYRAEIVCAVAEIMADLSHFQLIIDPVLVSSSGVPLLQPRARKDFQSKLLPLATLITPNLPEAESLTGRAIREPEDMRSAARVLHDQTGSAILIKGGHGGINGPAVDLLFDGHEEYLFSLPRLAGRGVHGTGCALSAAITASLAHGSSLVEAVQSGKEFTTRAMAFYKRVHGQRVLAFSEGLGET